MLSSLFLLRGIQREQCLGSVPFYDSADTDYS